MHKVRPKKSLGQHFLTDSNIANKITDSLVNPENIQVLELGPGMGVLTDFLIVRFSNLTIVEIDFESIEYLKKRYTESKIKIVHANFIKAQLHEILQMPFCLIGNFPYNISSQIFFKLLEYRNHIPETVCMIQKEVADRIASPYGNKTYGILSVLLQTWFDIEFLFNVPPHVFSPPPKVNSSVIRLTRNKRSHIECNELFHKQLIKTAFNQRRKTLRNALKPMQLDLSLIDPAILDRRAERLDIEDFINLATILNPD
jgi:16S rRNA (adenine1518-N6/adenine1519-N6)-dimethyltransferase